MSCKISRYPLCPVLLLVFVLNVPALAYEAPLVIDADIAIGYDNNIGNSGVSADRLSDSFIEAGVRANRLWQHGLLLSSELEASVRTRQYRDYSRLSQLVPGLTGRLNYRHPGGFYMPVVTGWIDVSRIDSRSELREGSMSRAGVSLKQPLTTRLNLWLTATGARRRADNDVFSYGFHTLGIQLGWQPVDTLQVYAGYNQRAGGLVASAREDTDVESAARAWRLDDALGSADDEYIAYRLDAFSGRYVAGMSWSMGGCYILDFQADIVDAEGDYKMRYSRARMWLGLSRRSGTGC